jgi:hypothetical protein
MRLTLLLAIAISATGMTLRDKQTPELVRSVVLTLQVRALMSAPQNASPEGLDPNDYFAWRWQVSRTKSLCPRSRYGQALTNFSESMKSTSGGKFGSDGAKKMTILRILIAIRVASTPCRLVCCSRPATGDCSHRSAQFRKVSSPAPLLKARLSPQKGTCSQSRDSNVPRDASR